MMIGRDGTNIPRDVGYRCLAVFQGKQDAEPSLYASTFASAKGRGTNILRCIDGINFAPVTKPDAFGEEVYTLRLLTPFKGRLFTAATGRPGGNANVSNLTLVFETRDPVSGPWIAASEADFGDRGNLSIFEMETCGDYLYAGTANLSGYQVWRTTADGAPPYQWEKVLTEGAYRGRNNQGVASFCDFRRAMYVRQRHSARWHRFAQQDRPGWFRTGPHQPRQQLGPDRRRGARHARRSKRAAVGIRPRL